MASDRLLSGASISRGTQLVSQGGQYRLAFQTDGNLVLYNNKNQAFWSPNIANKGGTTAVMQKDGNFVVYAGKKPLFATRTVGRPEAYLVIQKDGNLVIYHAGKPIWNSNTVGGHLPIRKKKGPGAWLAKAAKSAGKGITGAVSGGFKAIGKVAGKIPIVGAPIGSVLKFAGTPFAMTDAIVNGARIDKAVLNSVKDQVAAVREIAPYAKLVMTAIPGIGSGVSAAIAFGSAAVSGRPLDKAFVEGLKGAIPGGPLAKGVFDYTQKVIAGENVLKATANTALAQLPKEARAALDVVQKAARGENIPMAALEAARKQLPPEAQKALDVGVAIGQGKKLQTAVATGVGIIGKAELEKFAGKGASVIAGNPVFKAGVVIAKNPGTRKGYEVGAGLMSFSGVNEATLTSIREKLGKEAQKGFDMAVSAQIGQVEAPPPPPGLSSKAEAAYYTTRGMEGGGSNQKAEMMKVIVDDPEAKKGAVVAINQMPHSWWQKLLRSLGFR